MLNDIARRLLPDAWVDKYDEEDTRYTVYVYDGHRWLHLGWRDTAEGAERAVRYHVEEGAPAFYIEGEHVMLPEWDIEVDPAA